MPIREDSLGSIAIGIRRHEHFEEAIKHHVENLLKWRCSLGGFNKVISSHARNFIMNSVLYLHFQARPDDPDEGATYERLLKFCVDRGFCGPRVLRTVLMLAEGSGRLTVERGRFDRRLKIFRPTELLLAQSRECEEHVLDCFDILMKERSPRRGSLSRDTLSRRMISVAGRRYFEDRVDLCEHYEDLLELLRLDGGYATVLAVTDAQLKGMAPPPYKEIAARFRFSASQSRKILKRAEDLGLAKFSGGGRLADASGLVRTYRWAVARELALHAKYAFGLGPYFERRPGERRAPAKLDAIDDPFGDSRVAAWDGPERRRLAREASA
jgi:hypothetical protein